jgi:ParB family chromosome partitioning protein
MRLGRGLTALLGEYSTVRSPTEGSDGAQSPQDGDERLNQSSEIPIDRIVANPRQPRRTFVESDLEDLAASIRLKGVLQPILVRPDPTAPEMFEIVAGERRWRAARRIGLATVPALVRDLDDRDVLEIAIVENVQRADLNAIEEAEAYRSLMERFGRTQDSVATQVGKSREHIANTVRLLQLPEDVREHVREGRLSPGHGRALLASSEASKLSMVVIEKGLSVRETEALSRPRKPSAGDVRPVEDKDVDTRALELDLQRALGLNVDIRHTNGRGGEVRIRYAHLEQLDEICRLLSRSRHVVSESSAVDVTDDEGEEAAAGSQIVETRAASDEESAGQA